MTLELWQVDAFAEKPFEGNPAAIVPLKAWIADALMQRIAAENNLSETAFFVNEPERGEGFYHLRWFTPAVEVPLCGHATLASAYVLFSELKERAERLTFRTLSGDLTVARGRDGMLAMALPLFEARPHMAGSAFRDALLVALGRRPVDVFDANYPIAVFENADDVRHAQSGGALAGALAAFDAGGLSVTAPSDLPGFDYVSRFFAPGKGIAEDPVTGSSHAALAPFWGKRKGLERLTARQISPRGGTVLAELRPGQVILSGRCVPYLRGTIHV